jgi:hypothetical protein
VHFLERGVDLPVRRSSFALKMSSPSVGSRRSMSSLVLNEKRFPMQAALRPNPSAASHVLTSSSDHSSSDLTARQQRLVSLQGRGEADKGRGRALKWRRTEAGKNKGKGKTQGASTFGIAHLVVTADRYRASCVCEMMQCLLM